MDRVIAQQLEIERLDGTLAIVSDTASRRLKNIRELRDEKEWLEVALKYTNEMYNALYAERDALKRDLRAATSQLNNHWCPRHAQVPDHTHFEAWQMSAEILDAISIVESRVDAIAPKLDRIEDALKSLVSP